MLEKVRTGLECFSKTKKYTLGNFSKQAETNFS